MSKQRFFQVESSGVEHSYIDPVFDLISDDDISD